MVAGWQAFAREGQREEAVRELSQGDEVFAGCGELRLREEAVREVKRLGKRVPYALRPPCLGATLLPDQPRARNR